MRCVAGLKMSSSSSQQQMKKAFTYQLAQLVSSWSAARNRQQQQIAPFAAPGIRGPAPGPRHHQMVGRRSESSPPPLVAKFMLSTRMS